MQNFAALRRRHDRLQAFGNFVRRHSKRKTDRRSRERVQNIVFAVKRKRDFRRIITCLQNKMSFAETLETDIFRHYVRLIFEAVSQNFPFR